MSNAQLDCPEGVQTFQFEFKLWVCGYTCVRRWKPGDPLMETQPKALYMHHES